MLHFHIETSYLNLFSFQLLRWVHGECASLVTLPEEKCVCLLCQEAQQQLAVTQNGTGATQTRAACEDTEGHTGSVEMTIQTQAGEANTEEAGSSEVTVGQTGTSEELLLAQAEVTADCEEPMELGKSWSRFAQTK